MLGFLAAELGAALPASKFLVPFNYPQATTTLILIPCDDANALALVERTLIALMANPIIYSKAGRQFAEGSMCHRWVNGAWTAPDARLIGVDHDGRGRPVALIETAHRRKPERLPLMLLHPQVVPSCYPAEPDAQELTTMTGGMAWI